MSERELAFGRQRTLIINIAITLALLLIVELACRAIAFVKEGFNPYYLTYGFKSAGLAMTTNAVPFEGYWKFAPGAIITQGPRSELRIPSRINNIGMRGTKEIRVERAPNVRRIVCLGESSTFGYHARDEFTFPALLESKLNGQSKVGSFEVINAGIPSFRSDNLVAILKAELLAYRPDVIIVYAAYNDATQLLDEAAMQSFARWLYDHVATYVAVKKIVERFSSTTLYSKWSPYAKAPTKDYLDRQIALHNARYRDNLQRILDMAGSVKSKLILVRQPMTTWKYFGLHDDRPTYQETVRAVRTRLERGEAIDWEETTLLVHSALLETLDAFARNANLPLVDNVRLVDARKDRLLSYVHLSEEGNDALAEALTGPVLSALNLAPGQR